MDRPITTLFMLMSVDGKISTGATDDLDVDRDFPKIVGVQEGLHQYYEIEQTTDLWSLNSGRVQEKLGVNSKEMPNKLPVSFVMIDNHHLTKQGIRYFCARSKEFVLVTSNADHPAFQMDEDNLHIICQKMCIRDSLFSGGGAIGAAEALWAKVFHMASCLFLTGGSTQGVHAALALACKPGETVLLDRGSHRSAYNALALLDLKPVYLERPWLASEGITGPISPSSVAQALEEHPEAKTLCITSPTYYGVLSDLPALAELMHRRGGVLVVDGAHGAHLPFLGNDHLSAADLVVTSAHKTLPALGQSALLLAGERFPHAGLRRAASLYGSSSPSYPMMACLDLCRAWMEEEGAAAYRAAARQVAALRRDYPSVSGPALDPARLVLRAPDGFAAQAALEGMGVWPEMADAGHVVFIPTCADTEEDFARLRAALDAVAWGDGAPLPPPPPPPEAVLTPRQALFSPRISLPLSAAEGRICAQQVAPYPPGVPVFAPGERICKKTIAYLKQIGYNTLEDVEVVSEPVCAS